ncbi:hypothetical protein [Burkholderia pseudomallei]|uniref:hypothetical protein n=1 Tax=Burkholderia pseudomallei TaxID=28450 RepID=UPI0005E58B64|nr:hypothetical protein [Burkholderia pseudomallei]CAJ9925492.1 Uncharacterised protein [Burkholderia pseudomallei]CAK1307617.1 Uncharacterised protein [Burkholderia pseudomallei]CPG54414.1 Uncharacterised protein [Burkholderia pseudomallei]
MSHVPAPPTADQVRTIRIAALELLLAIEMAGVRAEPESDFVATLHKLAENPVREDLRPLTEVAR